MKDQMVTLAYRPKYGKKQYTFTNWSQFRTWRSRHPFNKETHLVIVYVKGEETQRFIQPPQLDIDNGKITKIRDVIKEFQLELPV